MSTEQVLNFFMAVGAVLVGSMILAVFISTATDYFKDIKFKKD